MAQDRPFIWLEELLEDPDMLKPPKPLASRIVWPNRITMLAAREKGGKALALGTPIPTPSGWTTMGALQTGDEVFGPTGEICRVVVGGQIQHDRPCYEVEFSDGEVIVADAEHEWLTTSYTPRNVVAIRTTQEIAQSMTCSKKGLHNHRIQVCDRLELPKADLPVSPYALGFWLGDGHSASARITIGNKDADTILGALEEEGIETNKNKSPNENSELYHLKDVQGKLRALNVLNNKHIPQIYLRASYEQRMSLLRGLMDSDGYVTKRGRGNYDTTSQQLRDGVVELLRTLGMKPYVNTKRATLYGKDCGESYRVTFTAYQGTNIATLKRKLERLRPKPKRLCRSLGRKIVAVRKVESVPVRCIQVDSPSHLFLAGRSFVPTHNSTLAGAVTAAVSSGSPFLGEDTVGGNVLIVALEEHPQEYVQRLVGFGANPKKVAIVQGNTQDIIAEIRASAEEINPVLIVWDTLGALADRICQRPLEPNDSSGWTRVMSEVVAISREYGASLLLHHANKSDGKYRDSTAIGANVDVIIEMYGEKDAPRVLKTVARFNVPETKILLDNGVYRLLESDKEIQNKIVDFVRDNPQCSFNALAKGVGGNAAAIRKARNGALSEGRIQDVGTAGNFKYIVP